MRESPAHDPASGGPVGPWTAARVLVVLGAYGSGKSEVAVNLALHLRRTRDDVTLVDLDTINPYFRSNDARAALETAGVRVVAPSTAGTNADVPAVPGEVHGAFDAPGTFVFDIGGEDMGARVVSSLRDGFARCGAVVLMVVNRSRPFTADAERIADMADELAAASGLPVDAFVDNTNLLGESDGRILLDSIGEVRAAGARRGIPLAFASGVDALLPPEWKDALPDGTPLLRMRRHLIYPYENGA